MQDEFTTYWDETPVIVTAIPQEIRAAQLKHSIADAALPPLNDVLQIFGNESRNSRLALPINLLTPELARFSLRWSTDLPESIQPVALLCTGNRIVVNGLSTWRLYDVDGQLLQSLPLGPSRVVLHPPWSVCFAADLSGLVNAHHLENGRRAFTVSLNFSKEFSRNFMAAIGDTLITLSTEEPVDMHGPAPEKSTIEVTDLGKRHNMRSWNEPNGPVVTADLIRESRIVRAAIHGETIVFATVDRIFLIDFTLNITRILTGTFLPIELSVDEAGQIYLIVYSDEHSALWVLTQTGERLYSFDLPASFRTPSVPPIVGYDHTAYAVSTQHIFSIAVDGKMNWMRPGLGQIGGASIAADNQLLVSEGDTVSAWDAGGRRRILQTFPGEQLTTAPILLPNGDLLVATETRLICLRRLPPLEERG